MLARPANAPRRRLEIIEQIIGRRRINDAVATILAMRARDRSSIETATGRAQPD
jgi:hypothetical protein